MKTRSAKNKGKRLEKLVLDKLKAFFDFDADDIRTTVGSETGADIKIAQKYRTSFPFAIECKNQEAVGPIYKMVEQSQSHAGTDAFPLLIIKKNRCAPLCVMALDDLFTLMVKAGYGK